MSDTQIAIVVGSTVLVIAAIFVAGHYRREHRRQELLQNLDHHEWWDWNGCWP